MAGKNNNEELLELTASDGVSSIPDVNSSGDSSRSADKSGGDETYSDTTKSEVLNAIMNNIARLGKDALVDIYKAYGPTGNLHHGRPKDKTAGELSVIKLAPTSAGVKEDVEEIFGGDELSEEIKNKASIVFEAAINARLVVETARLEEEFETRVETAIEEIRSEIVENVDKYLSFGVEEWIEENKVAIDAGLKIEMAEELINGLKGLFEENYIDIPETKIDVVAEMAERVEELEAKLNEEIEKNHNLKESNLALSVEQTFNDMTEGLIETQVEKLRILSEGVSYASPIDYKNKLAVIKETYFPSSPKAKTESTILTEEFTSDSNDYVEPTSGPMAAYVKAATKMSKHSN
jgi:hypothetical protein